jgi:catalase-peroxidase
LYHYTPLNAARRPQHSSTHYPPPRSPKPGLSHADLIILAGTAALEAASGADPGSFGFCPARVDAPEADPSLDVLAPRTYVNASVAVRDGFAVAGFTPAEGVALAGRPRSAAYIKGQGYSGTWGGAPGAFDNGYFKTLLGETWVESKSASGKAEFKAEGKGDIIMTPEDLAIRDDPELVKIAKGYAEDGAAFLKAFSAAWTKLVNADRFDGPAGNVCDDKPAPSLAVAAS